MALAKGRPLTAKVGLSMTPPPPQPACCAYMLAPIQHQIWAHLSMTAWYLDHLLVVRFPDPCFWNYYKCFFIYSFGPLCCFGCTFWLLQPHNPWALSFLTFTFVLWRSTWTIEHSCWAENDLLLLTFNSIVLNLKIWCNPLFSPIDENFHLVSTSGF